jgi:hypothetical protein
MLQRKRAFSGLTATLAALLLAAPLAGNAQPAGIDPEATKILRRMTDFLASQQQFRVETQSTVEVVLTNGQKLQFDNSIAMTIQRPDRLRAERLGETLSQKFYYDGKSLSIHSPATKHYATIAAPLTLEAMLDFARDELDIAAPASDLIYRDANERLLQDVTSGFVVGKSVIGGVKTDHLAFSGKEVDWQVWVEEGAKPLPRKYVVTSKLVTGAPQYIVIIGKWNLAPKSADSSFSFTPPKDAKKVDFLPLAAETTAKR